MKTFTDQTDLVRAIKNLTDMNGSLKIKRIKLVGDQKVMVKTGSKWSFKRWFNSFMIRQIALDNGNYSVYAPITLKDGTEYNCLELAVINLAREYAIAEPPMGEVMMIAIPLGEGPLQYTEIAK